MLPYEWKLSNPRELLQVDVINYLVVLSTDTNKSLCVILEEDSSWPTKIEQRLASKKLIRLVFFDEVLFSDGK
jgi:hypothetical protein